MAAYKEVGRVDPVNATVQVCVWPQLVTRPAGETIHSFGMVKKRYNCKPMHPFSLSYQSGPYNVTRHEG